MSGPGRRPTARLDMDIRSPEERRGRVELAGRVEVLDCYRLGDVDLGAYAGLVVPPMVDQEHLVANRGLIEDYLESGGVVVFGGHLHRRWLPGSSSFVPLDRPSLAAYQVTHVADHPVFAGVVAADLTFRRGVAGFFARGHHPIPDGAQVLTRLAGGEPPTYIDQVTTAGTILVQSSCDLLGYAGAGDTSAGRIPGQLLDWIEAQARPGQRRAGTRHRWPEGPQEAAPALASRSAEGGLAAVYGGSAAHHRALTAPNYAAHLGAGLLRLRELADTDLRGLGGVVLPERLHQGLLAAAAPRLVELLDAGGTVIAFSGGEALPAFLPGVRWEHRPTNFWWWLEPGADLGLRAPTPDHPLFAHLDLAACTWHHHGVLHPPVGAEVVVALPSGEALLYVDQVSTPGTLVVAALDPLSHYGSYFMPATERFLDGFLPWAAAYVAD